jgi:hypothetical protein
MLLEVFLDGAPTHAQTAFDLADRPAFRIIELVLNAILRLSSSGRQGFPIHASAIAHYQMRKHRIS